MCRCFEFFSPGHTIYCRADSIFFFSSRLFSSPSSSLIHSLMLYVSWHNSHCAHKTSSDQKSNRLGKTAKSLGSGWCGLRFGDNLVDLICQNQHSRCIPTLGLVSSGPEALGAYSLIHMNVRPLTFLMNWIFKVANAIRFTAFVQCDNNNNKKTEETRKKGKKKSFTVGSTTLAHSAHPQTSSSQCVHNRIVEKEMKNIIFTFTQTRMYNIHKGVERVMGF